MIESRTMSEPLKLRGNRCFASLPAVIIGLLICKTCLFIAVGQAPLQSDALTYWRGGERIVDGDWLLLREPPEITRTPGYLLYVAFFQSVCGPRALAATIIVQQLLVLANAFLACWTCWQLTRAKSVVLLCLALSLFCISAHGVAVQLLSDTLLSFLLTLCVAAVSAWFVAPSPTRAAAIGAVLGAAILVKPVAQLAWAPIVVTMLFAVGRGLSWRRRATQATCVLLAAGLIVAPWLIRNQVYFGGPFLTKFAGRALWWSCFRESPVGRLNPSIPFAEDGPATNAVRGAVPDVDPHDTWATYKELVRRGYSQIDADDLMLCAAKEAIRAHPWEYCRSRCIRAIWFWVTPNGTCRPNAGDFEAGTVRPASEVPQRPSDDDDYQGQVAWHSSWYFTDGKLNFLWYPHPVLYAAAALTTLAALVVLLRTPACRAPATFFALWLAYFFIVTVVSGSPEYRYRMILEPTMIAISVTAWHRLRVGRPMKKDPAGGNGP
jgi:4-amino-4-deoxy-L-arabinose transferase-like glycosyltransferase